MLKTLKGKVSLVYMSLVAIILVLGSISLWSLMRISRAIDNVVVTNYNSIQRLGRMNDALNSQNTILLDYLDSGDRDKAASSIGVQTARFHESYDAEYATIIIPYEMGLIESIGSSYDEFLLSALGLLSQKDPAEAAALYEGEVTVRSGMVKQAIDALVASNENALFARKEEAKSTVTSASIVLGCLFLLAAVIGFFALRLYTDRLFRPIYELTQNLKAVRHGNLDRRPAVTSNDELGSLFEAFNNMTLRLAEFERSTMGQLLSERNRTLAIVRSITEPLIILDGDARVTLMNQSAEALFCLEPNEAVGQLLLDLDLGPGLRPFLARMSADARTYREEVLSLAEAGEARFYNVTLTPLDYEGLPSGSSILVFYDITELKRLDQMRSDFIATISHEFKTPLTSIVFGAGMLHDGMLGELDPAQAEVVGSIQEDGERLNGLVSDLLMLSKIESAETLYRFEPCPLAPILQGALDQFRPLAQQRGLSLSGVWPDGLPPVLADAGKLRWVLNNLLSNALKYVAPGGTITLEAFPGGDGLTCVVRDDGEGIPPEFLERIFDKYVQVNSYDLEMRGSGLGLAVAKAIIQAHQGRIWCESGTGQGSSFFFTLPLVPAEKEVGLCEES